MIARLHQFYTEWNVEKIMTHSHVKKLRRRTTRSVAP